MVWLCFFAVVILSKNTALFQKMESVNQELRAKVTTFQSDCDTAILAEAYHSRMSIIKNGEEQVICKRAIPQTKRICNRVQGGKK